MVRNCQKNQLEDNGIQRPTGVRGLRETTARSARLWCSPAAADAGRSAYYSGNAVASPNSRPRRSEKKMNEPFIFVSYRRSDTTPYTLALKAELEHRLSSAFVFLDIERLQAKDRWPEILDHALTRARVLILMIGASWIEREDSSKPPRLFDETDWVRKEVVSFL